ncbi:MAG: class I tRNA ligase family protein, partial [Candidatus Poribacteria bacterium]|nr:class I tRNA ligase family protein [Candidatus Poribacteria bacterium]
PVDRLSVDTLRRKIFQDIFLKYEMMQGKTVVYSPLWETFPFSVEVTVIKESTAKVSGNIINLRKQCKQFYGEQLKIQQQKLQKLGIFADWTSAEKTLETRHETKLFGFFDRLRDAEFLRDELKLSHWCPKCVSPLEVGKTVTSVSNSVLDTYVKFPFNTGFEELGKDVYFAVRFPLSQLSEIVGMIAIGIYENSNFLLTEFENQYLIFSKRQFNKLVDPNAKRKKYPKPITELEVRQFSNCTVSHPLFSLTDLPFFMIPEKIVESISDSSEKKELMEGIIPLNPAHHSLSYNIYKTLPNIDNSTQANSISSTPTTPVFDETGRFTEDADTLCGLNLSNAIEFIIDELEGRGCLIKARKQKIKQLECQHCSGLSVARPYRHWMFSITSSDIREELSNCPEYWNHYDDEIRENIQNEMMNVSDMPISSQRQWGIPLPVLRCDNCNSLITDKKILRAVRSSIRRGSEHWFRLSVEELLPADTVCENCHSKEFRKELTYIESHFANLLQTLDTSDFKKSTIAASTNVAFVPRTPFLKWLGELSVLSASLQLSRSTKESQPFKFLKLNDIAEEVWDTEVQEKILQKYPADVLRLISIVPDLHQVQLKGDGAKQLEELIAEYNQKYAQLKEILYQAVELLADLQEKGNSVTHTIFSKGLNEDITASLQEPDMLAVSLTNRLLIDIEAAYYGKDFYEMWRLLYGFCHTELLFYLEFCCGKIPKKRSDSVQIALLLISKSILQRLAPIHPFLAEEIFAQINIFSKSIFRSEWCQLPEISEQIDVKVEWESFKKNYQSTT